MTHFRALSAGFSILCFRLFAGNLGLYAAQASMPATQSQTAAKAACSLAGEVFGRDDLARTLLLKRDDTGGLETIRYSKSTHFIELSAEARPVEAGMIDPANIEIGDRLCVQFPGAGRASASAILVLTRSEVQRQQVQVLSALHRNSAFGSIAGLDAAARAIELRRISLDGTVHDITVDARDPALFRRYAPDAEIITSVSVASWDQLRIGEQIYVRGQRSADGTCLRAALVILGGFRTMVGTVTSIDALHECIEVKSLHSERASNLHVQPQALFRISPFIPDGMATVNTTSSRQGWRLHSLEFADLERGDSVAALIRVGDPSSDIHALAVVTGFGSFGLLPRHPDAQVLWFLDPLHLDLP